MELILSHISAFRYHRIPPQVLTLLPGLDELGHQQGRKKLSLHPESIGDIELPIRSLVFDPHHRQRRNTILTHMWSVDLPFGAIEETDFGFSVTSPLFTLLLLAPRMHIVSLIMMLMEVCGTFSVYHPSEAIEQAFREYGLTDGAIGGWRRSVNNNGKPSDLWTRNPLVTFDELTRFLKSAQGMPGSAKLARAAQLIHGTVASPFEAQSTIKIELPPRMGGEGICITENNHRIWLPENARQLAGRDSCVADIFIQATGSTSDIDIECQSMLHHNSRAELISDSERITALQSIGVEVIPLTYKMLANPTSFRSFITHLATRLDIRTKSSTPWLRQREAELNRHLFIDWNTLGMESIQKRHRKTS